MNKKEIINYGKKSLQKKEITGIKKLFTSARKLIDESRKRVASAANQELTSLYWNIGNLINNVILQNKRAEYGKYVIIELSEYLSSVYGEGWGEKVLRHCIRVAETIPDRKILYSLRRELSWTQIRSCIYIDDPLKRNFYIEMSKLHSWNTRQLQERINSQLFERTALSKKPEELIAYELEEMRKGNKPSPEVLLKDPYILNFLGLKDRYLEKDLEDAILRELEKFILELGVGFTFVERQKRIQIDNKDYYIDLLFYNRKIKRLVAIELKIGDFEAAHKGQMELYLRWLAKYEQEKDEEPPMGLILCTGKSTEHIELLELGKSGIHVAEYLTVLPPRKVLEEKFRQSIETARERNIANKDNY